MTSSPHLRPHCLLVAGLLAACGGDAPAPAPDPGPAPAAQRAAQQASTDSSIAEMGELRAFPGLAFDGTVHLTSPDGEEASGPFRMLLVPGGGLLTRGKLAGIVRRSRLTRGSGTVRMGAAVRAMTEAELAVERDLRDDLTRLLVAGVTGDPAKPLARLQPGADRTLEVPEFAAGLPRVLAWQTPAGAWELAIESVTVLDAADVALALVPSSCDRPGTLGEPERREIPARSLVVVAHRGDYTDLARVDAFVESALSMSMARRRGPLERTFDTWPDAEGAATVTTGVPVRVSQDRRAQDLPQGARARTVPGQAVLVVPYVGPYPRDGTLHDHVREIAAELGLEPAGPPRHLILGDPEKDEPDRLRQEIVLPVRETEGPR